MMQKQNMACVRKKTFLGISLYEKYRTDDQLVRLNDMDHPPDA